MTDEKRKEVLDLFLNDNFNNGNALQLVIDNLPKFLYKYRAGTTYDLNALENNELWMANATLMDDPYDSKFLLTDEFRAQIDYVVNNVEHFRKLKYQKHLQEDSIQRDCYLCSLSETSNSNDMWARYANNDQGFCIQYDALELIKNIKYPILPIWYDEKPQEDADTLSKMSKRAMILKNFLIKNKVGNNGEDWYSQREWRIIAFGNMLEITADNKGKCIDAIKPSKIILGKDAPSVLYDKVIDWTSRPGNETILVEKRE